MTLHLYDEASLPAAGAVEDIDSINALLAMERITLANESYHIEPLLKEEAEDSHLEEDFEDAMSGTTWDELDD
jgi:hypothetical protein